MSEKIEIVWLRNRSQMTFELWAFSWCRGVLNAVISLCQTAANVNVNCKNTCCRSVIKQSFVCALLLSLLLYIFTLFVCSKRNQTNLIFNLLLNQDQSMWQQRSLQINLWRTRICITALKLWWEAALSKSVTTGPKSCRTSKYSLLYLIRSRFVAQLYPG